jgi:hypothetical protein
MAHPPGDSHALTVATPQARGVEFLSSPLRGLAGYFVCAQPPDGIILEFVELYATSDDRPYRQAPTALAMTPASPPHRGVTP